MTHHFITQSAAHLKLPLINYENISLYILQSQAIHLSILNNHEIPLASVNGEAPLGWMDGGAEIAGSSYNFELSYH